MAFTGTEISGNWAVESTSTTGIGDITLTGSDFGYVRFQQSHQDKSYVWYAITDGDNREAGVGYLDGSTIRRHNVTATLVNGTFTSGTNLPPISLSGSATVAGTFNASAFNELWGHIWKTNNPHDVIAIQVPYDNSNGGSATNVQTAIEEVRNLVATFSMDDLTDADTTTYPATIKQSLRWNGSNWIPDDVNATDVVIDTTSLETIEGTDVFGAFESVQNILSGLPDQLIYRGTILVADPDPTPIDPAFSDYYIFVDTGTRVGGDLDGVVIKIGDRIVYNSDLASWQHLPYGTVVDIADQPTAEAGVDNEKLMTPLRVHEAFKQFGLGITDTLPEPTDCDDPSLPCGFYQISGTTTNNPIGAACILIHTPRDAGTINSAGQIYLKIGAGAEYPEISFRRHTGTPAVWSDITNTATDSNFSFNGAKIHSDLDTDIKVSGFFRNEDGLSAGLPFNFLSVINQRIDSTTQVQLAFSRSTDEIWARRKAGSVLQSWFQLSTTALTQELVQTSAFAVPTVDGAPTNYVDPEAPTPAEELDLAKRKKIKEIEAEFYGRAEADGIEIPYRAAKSMLLVFTPISPATPESTRFYGNIPVASGAIATVEAFTDINDVTAFNVQTDVSWT